MAMIEKKNGKSNYFKDVGKELKKVNYPSVSQVRRNTIIVIVLSIIVGIFIAILDGIFGTGATWLLDQKNAATVATATAAPDNSGYQIDENGNIVDANGNVVATYSPELFATDATGDGASTDTTGGQ